MQSALKSHTEFLSIQPPCAHLGKEIKLSIVPRLLQIGPIGISKDEGRVVQIPISANPGLSVNKTISCHSS